jgi:hypothetical protein
VGKHEALLVNAASTIHSIVRYSASEAHYDRRTIRRT